MIFSYVESNIKNDTNEVIYKTETALQILKMNWRLPEETCWERDELGTWDEYTQTTI